MKKSLMLLLLFTICIVSSCEKKSIKNDLEKEKQTSIDENYRKLKTNDSLQTEIQKITNPQNYLIKKGSVGVFKIGSPVPSSVNGLILTKKNIIHHTDEGEDIVPICSVLENGQEIMQLRYTYDDKSGNYTNTIGEINIFSSKYKTNEGIGVNLSIETIFEKYPNTKISHSYICQCFWIDIEDYCCMELQLNENDFIGKEEELNYGSDMGYIKKTSFKKGALIKSIKFYN